MKKKNMILIIIAAIVLILGVVLVMRLSKGKVLHSYNSKNLTGIKGVYVDHGQMTIEFNKKYAYSDEEGYGSIQAFFDVEKDTDRWIYIKLNETSITIKGENIKSNKNRGTISFMIKNLDAEKISEIRFFCYASDTTISFESGELTCILVGHDSYDILYKTYTQTYDEKKHTWSEYTYHLNTVHIDT